MSAASKTERAREAGRAAFIADETAEACPHPSGTDERLAWLQGYSGTEEPEWDVDGAALGWMDVGEAEAYMRRNGQRS